MTRTLCPILAMTLTSAAVAGPIERAWVAPEAAWVIHVDLAGLLGSQSFEEFTEIAGVNIEEIEREIHADLHDDLKIEGKEIPPHVLEAWRNLDFSVTEDLLSITVFGAAGAEEPDLVILRTTDAVDEIVGTLDPIEGIKVAQGDQVSFVALRPEGADEDAPDHVLAIRKELTGERTVVICPDTPRLIAAMETHAMQSKRAAPAGPDWMSMRPGSFFLAHITGDAIAKLGEDAPAQILENARELRIEAGESANETYIDAVVDTQNPEIVNQVAAIANGLMALGRLGLASEPEGEHLITLMNGLRISTDDTAVVIQFRMDSGDLGETLRALEEMDSDGIERIEEIEIHTHEAETY